MAGAYRQIVSCNVEQRRADGDCVLKRANVYNSHMFPLGSREMDQEKHEDRDDVTLAS